MVDQRGPTERTGKDVPKRAPGAVVPVALGIFAFMVIVAVILAVLVWT